MVLTTDKSERHRCNLLSNNKQSQMKLLHLNVDQGDSQLHVLERDYVNINNRVMDITRRSFSHFISNNVTSVAGGNITMEIQFKFGGVVWIEVQASCGANMTCYTFQGQQPKLSAHLNRSCENIKATTIVTSVSSSATTIVTSLNLATTIVTSPLTEASTSVTSSKSKATTIVINPFKQASTIATTFETIATTSATSPLKEDELSTLKYIAICVGVVAIVFLVLFIIFCAKFYRRKKKKTELNIYDIPEIHKEDQSPYDNDSNLRRGVYEEL
ncbi:hypothetical protein Btru_074765 [Bulinus truncatus]|nr:hypothetical protein Btru_074765 [Bulinus truncatus]